MQDNIGIYERALKREKAARQAAEKILEEKASELFELNRELNAKNLILQQNFTSKEKELQDLFQSLVEGYVISNLDGFILKVNDSAKDMLELKPSGSFNLNSLIANEDKSHLNQGISELLKKESLSDFELNIKTPSGNKKTIVLNASSIKDADGKVVAVQALLRDVTDIRKLESAQASLLTKLKNQNQELEEFAHVISHDLKSPLRNLYTLNTWIQESVGDEKNPKTKEYFSLIFSTLERMDNMIHEILHFSKSDKDAMEFENVDLNSILKDLHQQYTPNEHLKIEIADNFPTVYGVKVKLFQVFQNLIDNAIKFNNKEQGIIKVYYEDLDHNHVRVSVYDNGKGISKRQQEKVFKLFETSEKDKSSSGVGLAIVKKILEAHQSEIKLESEVNVYTTFTFNLRKAI